MAKNTIRKIQGLAKLLFVPGVLWKVNKEIQRQERESCTTEREQRLQSELQVYADAGMMGLEISRDIGYATLAAYSVYSAFHALS